MAESDDEVVDDTDPAPSRVQVRGCLVVALVAVLVLGVLILGLGIRDSRDRRERRQYEAAFVEGWNRVSDVQSAHGFDDCVARIDADPTAAYTVECIEATERMAGAVETFLTQLAPIHVHSSYQRADAGLRVALVDSKAALAQWIKSARAHDATALQASVTEFEQANLDLVLRNFINEVYGD